MENDLIYEKKYLKYKEKYNILKSQTGGIKLTYFKNNYVIIFPNESINIFKTDELKKKVLVANFDTITSAIGLNSFIFDTDTMPNKHAKDKQFTITRNIHSAKLASDDAAEFIRKTTHGDLNHKITKLQNEAQKISDKLIEIKTKAESMGSTFKPTITFNPAMSYTITDIPDKNRIFMDEALWIQKDTITSSDDFKNKVTPIITEVSKHNEKFGLNARAGYSAAQVRIEKGVVYLEQLFDSTNASSDPAPAPAPVTA
jgi:hypothetical protein